MVCCVRLSAAFIEEVRTVALKNGALYFLEIMFPSFGHGGRFVLRSIPEMDNIVYRAIYSPAEIRSEHLYHPLKGWGLQGRFRAEMP